MRRAIPNLLTSLNAISGTIAIILIIYEDLFIAALFILLAMLFDFFDGFAARLLRVSSELGKELDSLADVISFGVAPALIAHRLIDYEMTVDGIRCDLLTYIPVIMVAFSVYRLAKFNLDTRQSHTFIGLPTPANALFWIGLVFAFAYTPGFYDTIWGSPYTLIVCVILLSLLLVAELPMFSLKIKGFSWRENRSLYMYIGVIIVAIIALGKGVFSFIIPIYILLAILERILVWLKR